MTPQTFDQYWKAITIIDSRDFLRSLQISDHPHVNKHHRNETVRKRKREAFPADTTKKAMSTEDIAKMLGAMNG